MINVVVLLEVSRDNFELLLVHIHNDVTYTCDIIHLYVQQCINLCFGWPSNCTKMTNGINCSMWRILFSASSKDNIGGLWRHANLVHTPYPAMDTYFHCYKNTLSLSCLFYNISSPSRSWRVFLTAFYWRMCETLISYLFIDNVIWMSFSWGSNTAGRWVLKCVLLKALRQPLGTCHILCDANC